MTELLEWKDLTKEDKLHVIDGMFGLSFDLYKYRKEQMGEEIKIELLQPDTLFRICEFTFVEGSIIPENPYVPYNNYYSPL